MSDHSNRPASRDQSLSPLEQLAQQWLPAVAAGEMSYSELAERILRLEYQPGRAYQADTDRQRRCGYAEVIFGSGKSAELITKIADRLIDGGQTQVLVTRVERPVASEVITRFAFSRYDVSGRTLRLSREPIGPLSHSEKPAVVVVSAGSTDIPVAREALETLDWMGIHAQAINDVGVAGPYRLLPHLDTLREAVVVVVVAGMEGALASVVGGLVPCPVIAVPTSVGYGANLQGITTMLAMLSSCAAGVTVVNVDAGFKGGYVAGLIARQVQRAIASSAAR
ncbi:MAG: nickel pincer cofactor biosynthesis protein LarB [Aureliella sp.]